jgi:hypothetical protein
MVEQIINDGLGNSITLKYDSDTDKVLVKNSGVNENFREIHLNDSIEVIEDVITIEDTNGPDEWTNYTDDFGRMEMQLFWDEHKKNKVTRGLS